MAYTRDELRDYWNTYIDTNGVQGITGDLMNQGGISIIDSMAMEADVAPANFKIYDVVDTNFTAIGDWNRSIVRWTGLAGGKLTLPAETTEIISAGYSFVVNNLSDTYNLTILAEGTDVINSHSKYLIIPAMSTATVYKGAAGATNYYYANISRTATKSTGYVKNDASGTVVNPTANVWIEIPIGNVAAGNLHNMTFNAPGLTIAMPNNATNGVGVVVRAHASIIIPNANQTVDFIFGVDSVIPHDGLYQSATTGASQTAGMAFPYSISFEGIVPNGSYISLFLRSSDGDQININNINMMVNASGYTGVNITV